MSLDLIFSFEIFHNKNLTLLKERWKPNMKIGYVRVSSHGQNTERQEIIMRNLGVQKVYIDIMSGKNTSRPELQKMLTEIQSGDTLIVESISRFARNTKDLLILVEKLDDKGIKFISQKENIDTATSTGKFMMTVFAAVAQLERDHLLQRQKEGIAIAKGKGKYKGRKPLEIDERKLQRLYKEWKGDRLSTKHFMLDMNLKPNTFYRRIKDFEASLK